MDCVARTICTSCGRWRKRSRCGTGCESEHGSAILRGLRQEELHAGQDIGETKRLTEEVVRSPFQRREPQSWIGRDDQDGNPWGLFGLTQLLHDLKPRHFRHLEIEQNQVIVILEMQRRDLFWVRRRRHIGISRTAKRELEQTDVRHLVVDDEYPDGRNVS